MYNAVGREVKERLNYLAAHRPVRFPLSPLTCSLRTFDCEKDPYYPRKKHDLGWYLKRSRSVACLRELMPIPEPATESVGPVELEGYF